MAQMYLWASKEYSWWEFEVWIDWNARSTPDHWKPNIYKDYDEITEFYSECTKNHGKSWKYSDSIGIHLIEPGLARPGQARFLKDSIKSLRVPANP